MKYDDSVYELCPYENNVEPDTHIKIVQCHQHHAVIYRRFSVKILCNSVIIRTQVGSLQCNGGFCTRINVYCGQFWFKSTGVQHKSLIYLPDTVISDSALVKFARSGARPLLPPEISNSSRAVSAGYWIKTR